MNQFLLGMVLIISSMALAQTPSEGLSDQLAKQECVPYREDNGEVTKFICRNQTNGKFQEVAVQKNDTFKNVQNNNHGTQDLESYQKLGVSRSDHAMKVDQDQMHRGVQNAFQNSSPEVRAALIKAAKELRAKRELQDSSPPEQLSDAE